MTTGIVNLFQEDPKFIFTDHIVLIGNEKGFYGISKTLRLYSERPIIFFNQSQILPEKWKILNQFSNIFYYYGSYINMNHLEKLQIERCYKVIIIPRDNTDQLFPDAEAIVIARFIEGQYPKKKIPVLIQFSDENSIKLLNQRPSGNNTKSSYYNYNFWPYVVQGKIFLSSLFYSYFCKTLYNDAFSLFLNNLVCTEKNSNNGNRKLTETLVFN